MEGVWGLRPKRGVSLQGAAALPSCPLLSGSKFDRWQNDDRKRNTSYEYKTFRTTSEVCI